MILTELKCTNCNAPLRRDGEEYRCEHCGARYKVEGDAYDFHVIQVEHPHVQTLKCVTELDRSDIIRYGEEFCAAKVKANVEGSMVHQLRDFIRWDRQEDPFSDRVMIRGMIRVVEPSFRF